MLVLVMIFKTFYSRHAEVNAELPLIRTARWSPDKSNAVFASWRESRFVASGVRRSFW